MRAADIPVLSLEDPASGAAAKLRARSRARSRKIAPRRSCSAAPAWPISPPSCSVEFGVPVIDGVAAAVKQAEALVALGLTTSKRGAYARPLAKPYHGALQSFAPQAIATA